MEIRPAYLRTNQSTKELEEALQKEEKDLRMKKKHISIDRKRHHNTTPENNKKYIEMRMLLRRSNAASVRKPHLAAVLESLRREEAAKNVRNAPKTEVTVTGRVHLLRM
jgi:hypothetical protein